TTVTTSSRSQPPPRTRATTRQRRTTPGARTTSTASGGRSPHAGGATSGERRDLRGLRRALCGLREDSMSVYYQDDRVTLYHGDCLEVLLSLRDASVDSVVCDPPYGLEFMGKDWDSFKSTGSSSLLHSPKDEGRTFTNE